MAEPRAGPTAEPEADLQSRLRFESYLADVFSRFLQQPLANLPGEIDGALARLVEVLDVDRCGIGFFSPDKRTLVVAHSAPGPASPPTRAQELGAELPWWTEQLRQGRRVVLGVAAEELPPEAEAERQFVLGAGIRSHTMLPLVVAEEILGVPAMLIESELFGYERGAFTGALQRTVGRFELADKGTIFLDEIGELPLEVQAKLLRVVQSGDFERLGSARTIRTNARIIAATNRDLAREMREDRFRSDLYYRLSVFPVTLPPLRDRPEDIPSATGRSPAPGTPQRGSASTAPHSSSA